MTNRNEPFGFLTSMVGLFHGDDVRSVLWSYLLTFAAVAGLPERHEEVVDDRSSEDRSEEKGMKIACIGYIKDKSLID